jgi:cyclophilin family peptidyl-prolyl cis-trans isomerase
VFGKVVKGMDIVLSIPDRDPARAKEPGVKILSIDVTEA